MRFLIGALIVFAICEPLAIAQPVEESEIKEYAPQPKRDPQSSTIVIFRVASSPESGLASSDLINSLLQSSDLWKRASASVAKDIENPDWNLTLESIDVDSEPAPRPTTPPAGVYMARAFISSYDERLPASKLAKEVRHELASVLIQLAGDEQRVAELSALRDRMSERLLREKAELANLSRVIGIPALPEHLAQQELARRVGEHAAMTVEVEGLQARRQAIETQIAALGERTSKIVENDPVLEELKRVVQIRERVRNLSKAGEGAVNEVVMMAAEEKVAEARAELEKYRRIVVQASGGERLAELQRRLEDTEIELAECQRKRERLEPIAPDTAQLIEKRINIELAEQQYREVTEELNRLRLGLDFRRPSVQLIPLY